MKRFLIVLGTLLVFGVGVLVGVRFWPPFWPPFWLPWGSPTATNTETKGGEEREPLFYRHPMNPTITSPVPVKALERERRARERVPIYARQGGVVAELNVREGMYVRPDTRVMILADLSRVWVLVDVFEGQADWVSVGQRAEM